MTTRIFERTSITQYTFSSIAKDATGGGPLEIIETGEKGSHLGILKEVKVSCLSTDYSISIRAKTNALAGSIDEVHSKASINLTSAEKGLASHWVNGEDPKVSSLYLVLINSDGVNATGTITIQLSNEVNRRFARSGK